MWLIQIKWLRQFTIAAFLVGVTIAFFGLLVDGFGEAIQDVLGTATAGSSALLRVLIGGTLTVGAGYLAIGAFLNGCRALFAGFKGKYRWRARSIAPLIVVGLLTITMTACANRPELARPAGAWVHLNGDKYQLQNDISHAPPESGRVVGAQR